MSTCRTAIALAWDKLASLDPESVAKAGKIKYRAGKFEVIFLADTYIVDGKNQEVRRDKIEIGDYHSTLILHYLTGVKDIPLSGKMLSFKDIPSGRFYFPAFRRRSLQALLETFGSHPEYLLDAGKALEAEKTSRGDAGITVKVFPKLPLSLVIWKGDEELPAEATILFDATAPQILPTEDISTAAGMLVGRLVKESPKRVIQDQKVKTSPPELPWPSSLSQSRGPA